MKNNYKIKKEQIRSEAIEWQNNLLNEDYDYDWEEVSDRYNYFYKNSKRYGLFKEFKENGII